MYQLPKPRYDVGFKTYRRAHLYTVGNKEFPSVTKILNIIGGSKTNALCVWSRKSAIELARQELLAALERGEPMTAANLEIILLRAERQPERIKKDAADLGTRVHDAIDNYIAGKSIDLDVEAEIGFRNFLDWMDSEKLRLIKGDTPIASVRYKFGGRLDALAVDPQNTLFLLDWKTSNGLWDEYTLQVSGYNIALYETYGIKATRAKIVRFDKLNANVFEAKEVNLYNGERAFLAALRLHRRMNTGLWEQN